MMVNKLHIISGIPPGLTGTGRFLSHLIEESRSIMGWSINFHYLYYPAGNMRSLREERRFVWLIYALSQKFFSSLWLSAKLFVRSIFPNSVIIILHPQTVGFRRTLSLIQRWRKRAFIYGLDNSFFCVRSYNYIEGEAGPCLRCLGGKVEEADRMGCKPFPVRDQHAYNYIIELRNLLIDGEVSVFAQNERNAELYRKHGSTSVEVVGIWASDWNNAFEKHQDREGDGGFDVVFHGYFIPAKGAKWMLEVARLVPEATFLFPTTKPLDMDCIPKNVTFIPMKWEVGLENEVRRAHIVCIPSMWSATVEGSLIKSIACSKSVGCVSVPSAFGDEVPNGVVLKLDLDPKCAAEQIVRALELKWRPDSVLYSWWINRFRHDNKSVLKNMVEAIERHVVDVAI